MILHSQFARKKDLFSCGWEGLKDRLGRGIRHGSVPFYSDEPPIAQNGNKINHFVFYLGHNTICCVAWLRPFQSERGLFVFVILILGLKN